MSGTSSAGQLSNSAWKVFYDGQRATAFSSSKTTPIYQSRKDPDCPTSADRWQGEVKSLVGHFASYFTQEEYYCGASPAILRTYGTLNLATGKPVGLLELFSRAEVLRALSGDPFVQKALRDYGITGAISDLETINEALEVTRCLSLQPFDFREFAFFDYQQAKSVAGVRLSLRAKFKSCSPGFTQLGLSMLAPAQLRPQFLEAKLKKNLMADR
ncbi:hypothetical protein GO986_09530 [Deinococcus sp. HMF7620]|uniref:Uncharacterized protein n=1 Tax=Deinococcus arboris TaxID=2682977 RepID=A0A7C9IAV6_9DEIO|nr:hypothetical protein [Deinococcus arboris]MVN87006.1 hypothetical protein [Deinococcus arboris]